MRFRPQKKTLPTSKIVTETNSFDRLIFSRLAEVFFSRSESQNSSLKVLWPQKSSVKYFENSHKSFHFFQGLIWSTDFWLGLVFDPDISSRHLYDLDKWALVFQSFYDVQNNWICIFLNFSCNTNFLGNMEGELPRTKSMHNNLKVS